MKKILIVDDSEENIYLLKSILELNKYEVGTARNGKEAFDLMKKNIPDLIISDILMPVMDGFTLCTKCKQEKKLKDIPFFFYTATYTDKRDEEYALSLGADRFILKPQEPEVFLKIINDFDVDTENKKRPKKKFGASEEIILKEYNSVLIRKIEDKMQQTEKAEKEIREYAQKLEREIQERKLKDIELKAALEKAKESDRLKSAFLANLSHEIRTPMNGIMGFVELLDEPLLDGETQHTYVNLIKKSAKRMLNTITNIVNISKIESSQVNLRLTEVDINKELDFLYKFFLGDSKRKGIHLTYAKGLPDTDALIKMDHEKINGIMNNLISNAIKFTNEGTVEFGYEQKDNVLEFYVKDTGVGIRENKKGVIFERFRQGDDSITRPYEGLGLGLSITKTYVEIMGGKIWYESIPEEKEGHGTRFYVELPYQPLEKEFQKNQDHDFEFPSIQDEKTLNTLIVEDDSVSEKLLEVKLGPLSKKILKARNGKEAINACLTNNDLDLVLMDIKLPDMSGLDVTRHIRKFNKDLLIVAQTAFAMEGDREKAIEAGCNDYITKPIEIEKFNLILKKYDLI